MKRLLTITAAAVALLTALTTALAAWIWLDRAPAPAEPVATVFPTARALPDFALENHHGKPWTRASLQGDWQFLFFGFTHCPDVCPMTLATLAGAVDRLDADGGPVPEVVFVSVDPGRDDPGTLQRYVEHFNDAFMGVTGEREALDRLTGSLGISYSLGEPDENGDYPVDHSAAILLINPEGDWQALWQPPHGRELLAEEFRRIARRYDEAGR
jgi:protein SCO1/2